MKGQYSLLLVYVKQQFHLKTMFICLIPTAVIFLEYQTRMDFPICIKFPNYKSVGAHIYSLFVNSTQVQFENQFLDCIISDFFNEAIPISLIDSENFLEDR